jgi:hypothetical protein
MALQHSVKSEARFHLPRNCFQCDGVSTIVLQTVVQGDAVSLAWICQSCGRETPINIGRPNEPDRRKGPRERRRTTRKDRRKR